MIFLVSILVFAVSLAAFFYFLKQSKPRPEQPFPPKQAAEMSRVALIVAAAGIIGAVSQLVAVVPAGHVGVVDIFGRVPDLTLKAGVNLKNPMARVINLSIKTQELKEEMSVPSKEGLTVRLEVSVLYHLDPDKAADVYRRIGPNYARVIVEPQFRSVSRGVTAMYNAQALYTSEREVLSQLIAEGLSNLVEPRGVNIEATPLRQLTLPPKLTSAIEEKLGAEQESQRMQFVLMREEQEAERKRIEAAGIADFQTIVTEGISDELLRWKGIEATQQISQSPNTKVVIVGSGKDGLPIILGQ